MRETIDMIFKPVASLLVLPGLLLQCGDVEVNPGPMSRRVDPRLDKAKMMAEKVEAHDLKLEELEELIRSQAEMIESMQSEQVRN